ncbi:SBBP repeat-containing protein [Hymenobacter terricola]|uniref:SBBP repeat-containing protein n=1 Tax=Hymenobacter terricola TaxID=2819236 RepID=UPI001B314063|nr:SBBP repeat-containing protein [Hymenobacter terricola]
MKQLLLALLLLMSLTTRAQSNNYTFAYPVSEVNGLMGVATDDDGNVYTTGRFTGSLQVGATRLTSPGLCLYIAKYNAHGTVLQVTKLEASSYVMPYAIAVDRAGNSYVTGTFDGTLRYNNGRESTAQLAQAGSVGFTLRCRANGTVDWIQQAEGNHRGPAGGAVGTGIAVDAAGNSYVTGYIGGANVQLGSLTFGPRYQQPYVASYSAQGTLRWARVWTALHPNDQTVARGGNVAVNSAGDLYVSGNFQTGLGLNGPTLRTPGDNLYLFLAKLDPRQGQVQWAQALAGSGDGRVLTTTRQGDAYIGGSFAGTLTLGRHTITSNAGSNDVFVARYSARGVAKAATALGGDSYDVAEALAVNLRTNKVYLSGTLNIGGSVPNSAFLAEVSPQGRVRQLAAVGGPGTSSGGGLAVDEDDNLYLAGVFTQTCHFGAITLSSPSTQSFLARYGSQSGHHGHKDARPPLAVSIFPNPVQTQFTLRLTDAEQAVRATLFDHLGHAVAVRTLQPAAATPNTESSFDTSTLPNGLYMLRLESDKEITTRMLNVQH